jgi:hypothetical protein
MYLGREGISRALIDAATYNLAAFKEFQSWDFYSDV